MLIDLGKIIGGPDEGDGLIGKLLGLVAIGGAAAGAGEGVFDTVGGSSVADGFGAAATDTAAGFGRAAASEGWFAHLFREASFVDYWCMYDMGTAFTQRTRQAWNALSTEAQEVARAHGFLLQQLRAHGLTDLAEKYSQLGTQLPGNELLQQAYEKLARQFHTDTNPNIGNLSGELMAMLQDSKKALSDAHKTGKYREALLTNGKDVEDFLAKFTDVGTDWMKTYKAYADKVREEIIRDGRLIEGGAGEAKTASWFSKLSSGQKKGVIIGSIIAAISIGTYIGIRMERHHREKKHPAHDPMMAELPLPLLHEREIHGTAEEKAHAQSY